MPQDSTRRALLKIFANFLGSKQALSWTNLVGNSNTISTNLYSSMFVGCFTFVKLETDWYAIELQVYNLTESDDDTVVRLCLVDPKNLKLFKILRHIESCGTCMKH